MSDGGLEQFVWGKKNNWMRRLDEMDGPAKEEPIQFWILVFFLFYLSLCEMP